MSLLAGLLSTGCVRQHFFQADARPDAALPMPALADSVRGATAGRHYARHGRLYEALVGRHHRPSWAAPVAAPVFRLATARPGGLRPGKVGGGFNSTSLGLSAPDGRAYVLRTVDKDPIRATPKLLRGTFLVNALRDNVSSTNPYAALVVPPLATALGVPRAAPRLYYVRPDDPAFQSDSLRLFRGQLAYLEERTAVVPGNDVATEVVGSGKAFAAVFASPSQRFDQPALLRARLLDGWLGDWDRHPGQWSWAVGPPTAGGYAPLRPLPKDRDMVFYRLDDGVLGWLMGHLAIRHWVTFGPRYRTPVALFSNGDYLDRRVLNGLSRVQFETAARALQQQLPDTLLRQAVRRLPPAVFALEGARTIAALQARRAALPVLAAGLYQQLARCPVVGGTAAADTFVIKRYPDSTQVSVYPGNSLSGAALYRRTFLRTETKEISLQGLGGDDTFRVNNEPLARGIRLRIYGGLGTDALTDGSAQPLKKLLPALRFYQGSAPLRQAYDQPPKE